MIGSVFLATIFNQDIHLLASDTTTNIRGYVGFNHDGNFYFGNDADIPESISISFKGLFKGAPTAHGVSIDTQTGVIKIADTLPSPRLYNFILQVEVSEDGANSMHTQMRVHVHESIKTVWLSPASLTMYPFAAYQSRFSVHAKFEDEVYGDITFIDYVAPQDPRRLQYTSSNTSHVSVDESGLLLATTPEVSADLTITYGTLPAPHNLKCTAKVNVKKPVATPRKITRINPVGSVDLDKKTNILFIQDGFDNKYTFNKIVEEIVKGLQTEPYLFPYNKLKSAINYWRLDNDDFMESAEKGVTVLGEWYKNFDENFYSHLHGSKDPTVDDEIWYFDTLIYKVGLSVKANSTNTREQQVAIWKQLYEGIEEDKIPEFMWEWWQRELSTRKLVNERDTALGMIGRGNYQNIESGDYIRFNTERRIGWAQFMPLIENLQYENQTVGGTWTTGKDKGCICLLLRNHGGREYSNADFFIGTMGEGSSISLKPAVGDKRGMDLVPKSLTNSQNQLRPLDPRIIPTIAHECAHALGLGDEYVEFLVELPDSFEDPTGGDGNLMPKTVELITGDPERFNIDVVRWNWYRVKAVGMLKNEPVDKTDGKYEVSLEPGHAAHFKQGDIVRFRKRDLLRVLPFSLGRFEVTNIPNPNPEDKIELTKRSTDFLDTSEYRAGSLLVKTLQGKPASAGALGDDLKMIAPIIQRHLEKGIIPLNVAPPAAGAELTPCVERPDLRGIMIPLNLPEGLPAKIKNQEFNIVGLYEGGARVSCGVYHPAGFCHMGSSTEDKKAIRFCQVCRYLLIDRINPLEHKVADDEYDSFYPEP